MSRGRGWPIICTYLHPKPSVCHNGSCGCRLLFVSQCAGHPTIFGWRCTDCHGLTIFDPTLQRYRLEPEREPGVRP